MDAGYTFNPAILRPDYGPKGVDSHGGIGQDPPGNVLVNNPSEDGTSGHDTQSETAVVVGSADNVVVGYNDSFLYPSNHFTGYSISSDGGQTFTDKGAPPASSAGDAGDPILARDNVTGRIYFATLALNNPSIMWVFRSDDNGATFSSPVNAVSGFGSADKEWMAVDNSPGSGQGNVYLIARDFGSANGIFMFRSTDHGASFGTKVTIATAGSSGNVQGAFVTVGPDHTVYAFWYQSDTITGANGRILMRKSTDLGVTFGSAILVTNLASTLGVNGDLNLGGFRSNAFPQVAVNPVSGDLYAVFSNKGAGTQRADAFFTESTNGGTTWSSPVHVTDDTTTRDKWQPAIAVTPDGHSIGIFWYDRRNDPSNTNIDRYGVEGMISGHNVTFGANIRVSDQSFPPAFGRDSYVNGVYMGDYDQVAATNTSYYVPWGDNRLVQAGRNNPDVRFSQIPIQGATGDHFVIDAPSQVNSGDTFSITVTAEDPDGNIDPNYTGTVSFTSSDHRASLPGPYTFTGGDAGQHTFENVMLITGGNQSITASDGTVIGSTTISVIGATHFNIIAPSTIFTGTPFSITVQALDQNGNVVTNYTGTVHFTSSDNLATLPPDYTFDGSEGGQQQFDNVVLVTGGSQTIMVSDGSISGSATIIVRTPTSGFYPPVNYGVGSGPSNLVLADLNGDGSLDIATSNNNSNDVSILFNNGDGTYRLGPTLVDPLSKIPNAIAAGDLIGNGIMDLVTANLGTSATSSDGSISVFIGNGDGTFQPAINYNDPGGPSSVALYDLLGNGILDIVVANNGTGVVTVFIGNGDGTFQAPVKYAAGNGPVEVAIADFNLDGIPDLAVANQNSTFVSILIGNGDGTFKPAVNYNAGAVQLSVTTADFNLDGIPDLVTANYTANTVSVLIGNGDGSFKSPVTYAVGAYPSEVKVDDFNLDGNPDIVTSNYNGNTVSYLQGNGDGTFRAQKTYAAGTGPFFLASGDVDGDGMPDLVTANYSTNSVNVLINAGNFPPSTRQGHDRNVVLSGVTNVSTLPNQVASTASQAPATTDVLATTSLDGVFAAGLTRDLGVVLNHSRSKTLTWFDGAGLQPLSTDDLLLA
jgi:hypothetical protein